MSDKKSEVKPARVPRPIPTPGRDETFSERGHNAVPMQPRENTGDGDKK
jgi:hypothetical protein